MTIYLTETDIVTINAALIERYSPKEQVALLNPAALNMIVNLPEQYVFGRQLYPTLFEKSAILFIQLIKKHCFASANKRTAFYVLVKILKMNGYQLRVTKDEAVEWTVTLAQSPLDDQLLKACTQWIAERSIII